MTDDDLTESAIEEALRIDGFAVVDFLPHDAVRCLAEARETLAEPRSDGFNSSLLADSPEQRSAVHALIAGAIGERLRVLLPNHRIAFCTFVAKSPGSAAGEVPMHQDWSFVDETRYASFGFWCPLTDVDLDNGCLQVVRGSHAHDHPPRAAFSPFHYPELEAQLRADYLTSLPMRAGHAMLFDNRLFHCSPPNRSAAERIAATAVVVPRESRLRYYHLPDRREPHLVEVFEVDDGFYLTHRAPGRPLSGTSLGIVDIRPARR